MAQTLNMEADNFSKICKVYQSKRHYIQQELNLVITFKLVNITHIFYEEMTSVLCLPFYKTNHFLSTTQK